MESSTIRKINIDSEMQQAYLDYAMSVIVARALPDARDGLKPVQRRILYAMYDMGIRADSTYKKSARIVGEVLGKYHPHGDQAVYDAMARLAQDFSMRTMLVDGQGNFGSVDGDPPAAMRYTEARLSSSAMELLADLGKDTVDFGQNFDDTLTEPTVLPAALPNLLVNGATGIAVGMATSIPPHNLGEVVSALVYMLRNWDKLDDIDVEHLMQFIKGPDFPTGALILQAEGEDGLEAAYGSGRGKITLQAKTHIEEMERGKSRILVTELPYAVNKASLIERIADLARDGQLEGLSDLRDESDRHGMRIVIELTKTADANRVLKELYRRTPMQSTFSINLLALVDGEPRTLTLKQALKVYLEHRLVVIKRRSTFELERAKQRAHILEGYRVALKHLDEVINIIRNAADVETARAKLMKRYRLTEIQATAILDLQLRRIAALERKKIDTEYKEVTALIDELEGLLKSGKRMREAVAGELLKVKDAYGDKRRTQLVNVKPGETGTGKQSEPQWMPAEDILITVTADGLASQTAEADAPKTSGNSAPRWKLRAKSTDTVYFVTKLGKAAAVAAQMLPETAKPTDGSHFTKVSPLADTETLAAVIALPSRPGECPPDACVVVATRLGMVKKTAVKDLPGPSAQTFTMVKVNSGDVVIGIGLTDGRSKQIVLATALGNAIRFSEKEVRPMGLVATGVSGIKLTGKDEVTGLEILPNAGEFVMLSSNARAKRMEHSQLPTQGRAGRGVRVWELPDKTRLVSLLSAAPDRTGTMHFANAAAQEFQIGGIALHKRSTGRGDAVVELPTGDEARALTVMWDVEVFIKRALPKPTKAKKVRELKVKAAKAAKKSVRKQGASKAKPKRATAARKPAPKKSKPAAKARSAKKAKSGKKRK